MKRVSIHHSVSVKLNQKKQFLFYKNCLKWLKIQLSQILRQLPRMENTQPHGIKKFSTHCVEDFPHTVWKIGATTTPTGFHIKAQGCAYSRYPGWASNKNINPNGVAHYRVAKTPSVMCNPVGVDSLFASLPRVARIRATLGFDVKPLWGCGGWSQ